MEIFTSTETMVLPPFLYLSIHPPSPPPLSFLLSFPIPRFHHSTLLLSLIFTSAFLPFTPSSLDLPHYPSTSILPQSFISTHPFFFFNFLSFLFIYFTSLVKNGFLFCYLCLMFLTAEESRVIFRS